LKTLTTFFFGILFYQGIEDKQVASFGFFGRQSARRARRFCNDFTRQTSALGFIENGVLILIVFCFVKQSVLSGMMPFTNYCIWKSADYFICDNLCNLRIKNERFV
jgi:hypothetical protein